MSSAILERPVDASHWFSSCTPYLSGFTYSWCSTRRAPHLVHATLYGQKDVGGRQRNLLDYAQGTLNVRRE